MPVCLSERRARSSEAITGTGRGVMDGARGTHNGYPFNDSREESKRTMASEAEVVIGRCSDEACWTVDVTDRGQWPRWTRLTEKAGGEIIDKGPHWKRFHI